MKDAEKEYVNVKLEQNITVNFPRVLFSEEFLKYGQPVKYRIKVDKKGFKYQEVVPCKDVRPNPYGPEIDNLLDGFKYRDEE